MSDDDWAIRQARRAAQRSRRAQVAEDGVIFGQVVDANMVMTEMIGREQGVKFAVEAFEGLMDSFREMDEDELMTPREMVGIMEEFLRGWKQGMGYE